MFVFLRWSLKALAKGRFPSRRHDGLEWLPSDEYRESLQNAPLGFRGAVLQVKGDWSEFARTLGFPSWGHTLRPCIFCDCSREEWLAVLDDWSFDDPPFTLTTHEHYDRSCNSCELTRDLSREDHDLLKGLLSYDRRRDGGHGRCLTRGAPHLGLEEKDRLEPSPSLADVGLFETISVFPARVVFWRQRPTALSLHRNPLLDPTLGITIDTFCIDDLHTLGLGVYQRYVHHCLVSLIRSNAWAIHSHLADEIEFMSCERIRQELAEYYTRRRAYRPDITTIPFFRKDARGASIAIGEDESSRNQGYIKLCRGSDAAAGARGDNAKDAD